MDKNQSVGLLLMLALLLGWFYYTAPSAAEIEEQRRVQDSIALASEPASTTPTVDKVKSAPLFTPDQASPEAVAQEIDTTGNTTGVATTPKVAPTAQTYTLKNDKMTVEFSSQGGYPSSIVLHDYNKIAADKENNEVKLPLNLMGDEKNKFEYLLPIKNRADKVSTRQIVFDAEQSGQTLTFTGQIGGGATFTQTYVLGDEYTIDYTVSGSKLDQAFEPGTNSIEFNWEQYLDKLEKNVQFEKYYSTVYFKPTDDDSEYCSCRGDGEEESEESVKWISHANQFFNTAIIANSNPFQGGKFETKMMEDDDSSIKWTSSTTELAFAGAQASQNFTLYAGPNEFDRLRSYDIGLEEVIPFGRSIFGAINRWVIRPSFDFLSKYIGSKGVVIIVLIFIIKMLLYPLTYKMLYSQAKMGSLKPKLAKLTEKFKDDPQKKQVETMAIYREYGVSPLGGCMPMIVQMPIWYALFRFFPASITFRQEPFLWATDLSSYDVIATLPMTIPAFGSHISLFTVLWAVTTVLYTYYNTKHMDMSANPAMKYVQYAMPLMFLVFFNNYASGLTCYMFFSNLFNILQTVITKKFVFNDEKILAQLEENKGKNKDKPKTGFQARLEQAMKDSQEVAKKREAAKKKKK